jgi:para-aminobenzoate synthetase/4-amino-4-deoxychorismate lyase
MEIIGEVEADTRGPYTGAIGHLAPDGSAAFNVAIRTLVLPDGADEALIGLGSAVVADSTAEGEWRECLAKGAFVTAGQRAFDLIETMRFDPNDGIIELERHLARLGESARRLGFRFDRHAVRNEIHAATFRLMDACRVRLLLSPSGAVAIESRPLPPLQDGTASVRIVPLPVDPTDFRLAHKTSDRGFYDAARRAAGSFEILFARPDGLLTEGSFTNLFVPRDGRLVTPTLARGLLPGILRATLLDSGEAIEGDLTAADLAGGFFVGNALRGLIPAQLT